MNLLFALQYLVLMVLTPPLTPEIGRAHFKLVCDNVLVEMIMEATVEKLWVTFFNHEMHLNVIQ